MEGEGIEGGAQHAFKTWTQEPSYAPLSERTRSAIEALKSGNLRTLIKGNKGGLRRGKNQEHLTCKRRPSKPHLQILWVVGM